MRRQIIISLKCVVTFFMVAWWSNIQANPCFIGENASDTLVQPVAIPDTAAGVGEVYTEVDVRPDFPYKNMHGAEAFSAYIIDNFVCPPIANESSFQGRYYVSFIVEADGHISSINHVRLIEPIIDEEVIRVISNAPKWIPGEHKGKKVRTAYSVSVLIKF